MLQTNHWTIFYEGKKKSIFCKVSVICQSESSDENTAFMLLDIITLMKEQLLLALYEVTEKAKSFVS